MQASISQWMQDRDALRSRLPSLAVELNRGIEHALKQIREARDFTEAQGSEAAPSIARIMAWKKGLDDALLLLRNAEEAHNAFKQWLTEVAAHEAQSNGTIVEGSALIFEMSEEQGSNADVTGKLILHLDVDGRVTGFQFDGEADDRFALAAYQAGDRQVERVRDRILRDLALHPDGTVQK